MRRRLGLTCHNLAVSKAATVMSNPGEEHMETLKKIVRYAYHTRGISVYCCMKLNNNSIDFGYKHFDVGYVHDASGVLPLYAFN